MESVRRSMFRFALEELFISHIVIGKSVNETLYTLHTIFVLSIELEFSILILVLPLLDAELKWRLNHTSWGSRDTAEKRGYAM